MPCFGWRGARLRGATCRRSLAPGERCIAGSVAGLGLGRPLHNGASTAKPSARRNCPRRAAIGLRPFGPETVRRTVSGTGLTPRQALRFRRAGRCLSDCSRICSGNGHGLSADKVSTADIYYNIQITLHRTVSGTGLTPQWGGRRAPPSLFRQNGHLDQGLLCLALRRMRLFFVSRMRLFPGRRLNRAGFHRLRTT